jgi:RNA recognition motif-containing protein
MVKLFKVGFPSDMYEPQLSEILGNEGSCCGPVIDRDSRTQVSKGFGFINMVDEAAADRVNAGIHGGIDNRTLSVQVADDVRSVFDDSIDKDIPCKNFNHANGKSDNPGDCFRPKRLRK